MIDISRIALILTSFALIYIWLLYPATVIILQKFLGTKCWTNGGDSTSFSITVLIACLNEEDAIEERIENIYQSTFPNNRLEVIVISDGSTDKTTQRALQMSSGSRNVVVVENETKSGRATAHNLGVQSATNELLVFTDAGTTFEPDFLTAISQPFLQQNVGFVTGTLQYDNVGNTEVSQSVGLYWKFEQVLRQGESDLGINVFGSGACCAMRKSLYRNIPPTGDVDFTSPLDVALQNQLCIHQPKALAYDEMPDSRENELRARIRMTSKNFKGTIERWGWTGISNHPLKTIVILSHKYGRWITPFLLIAVFISSVADLAISGHTLTAALVLAQIAFFALGIIGHFKAKVRGASTVYSFLLGNYGIMLGVLKAISGQVVATYSPIRN